MSVLQYPHITSSVLCVAIMTPITLLSSTLSAAHHFILVFSCYPLIGIGATFSMNIEPNFAEGAFNTDASSLDQFESACGNYLDAVQDYVIQVTATSTEETTSDVPGSTCGDSYSDEHWKVNTTLDPPPSLRASNWSPSQQSRESVKRFLTYEFHGNRRVMNRTCIQHRLAVLVEKNESLCIMGDSHTRVLYYAAIEHLLGESIPGVLCQSNSTSAPRLRLLCLLTRE